MNELNFIAHFNCFVYLPLLDLKNGKTINLRQHIQALRYVYSYQKFHNVMDNPVVGFEFDLPLHFRIKLKFSMYNTRYLFTKTVAL